MIAALVSLALGGAAQAQELAPTQIPAPAQATSYPAATDGDALSAWLHEATDLRPELVVAVTPSAVTAIVARARAVDGTMEARLRAVAITPQAAARSGVLAWEMKLDVDCKGGQVRPGATIGFAARRAGADGVPLAPADAGWRKPKPNTTLDASMHAVCDATFQPPLIAAPTRVAQALPTGPAASPAVARPAVAPTVTRVRSSPAETPSSPPARLTPANVPLAAPMQAKPAPEKPRPVKAAPAAPTWGGHAAVQVVSSPDQAETKKKLASLQRRFGAALQGADTRVESAQVNGRTVYRGLVAGFATRREAVAFCQTLKHERQDCLAR